MPDEDVKLILSLDDNHEFFNTQGMYYKEFPSLFNQIRAFALFIVQKAPESFKEINLLEQQVSELVKNAIKHGNKCVPSKKIKVWYEFNETTYRT
ncbi:MAG: ATP-binding protein, partial [Spirochaetae bacterium HGW-Spirochaetae-6]